MNKAQYLFSKNMWSIGKSFIQEILTEHVLCAAYTVLTTEASGMNLPEE